MRSSVHRSEKYSKKITARVISGQADRYALTAAERIKLEAIVKRLGVMPMLAFSYLALAEQLWKIKKTYQGQTALDEAKNIANGWLLRGLDRTHIVAIGQALNLGYIVPGPLTRLEWYTTGETSNYIMHGLNWIAQSFTIGAVGPNQEARLTQLRLKLWRIGSPGTLTLSIKNVDGAQKPTGADLSTGTIDGNSVTPASPGQWYDIPMTAFDMQPGTMYAIVGRCLAGDAANAVYWRYDFVAATYPGGRSIYSNNGGVTWTFHTITDCMFEVWGRHI